MVTDHRFLRAWLALLLLGGSACTQESAPAVDVTTGALGLECEPGEIEVGEVGYTITRAGASYRNGKFSIDERHKEKGFSAVIGPLPVGDDYTIELQARAVRVRSGESSDCSGASGFSVAPRQTTVVAITLRCGGVRERSGDDNRCPRIDSVRAVPSEVPVGSTVTLRGDAHDVDRKITPLRFEWIAREGVLTDASQSRAAYMCTTPGRPAITLKVSDGDETCPEESVTVFVTCRKPPGGAGAGAGSAGSRSP